MVKFDDIDIKDKPNLMEQRKQLLTKIHDSITILENKVNCEIVDYIICRTGIDLNEWIIKYYYLINFGFYYDFNTQLILRKLKASWIQILFIFINEKSSGSSIT